MSGSAGHRRQIAAATLSDIIHHVEDVTEFITSREQATRESSERIDSARARADRMEAEVRLRASEVKEANRQIKAAMEELERREVELKRLNGQLKDLDRAKTAFFSNISHEFRTPLTLMLGSLEEVPSDVPASLLQAHRKRLTEAQRNSLRLLKLVNALPGFARIEAGRAQAAFEPVDLAAATSMQAIAMQTLSAATDDVLEVLETLDSTGEYWSHRQLKAKRWPKLPKFEAFHELEIFRYAFVSVR